MRRAKTNTTKYSGKTKTLTSHYKLLQVTTGIYIYCAFPLNFEYKF